MLYKCGSFVVSRLALHVTAGHGERSSRPIPSLFSIDVLLKACTLRHIRELLAQIMT
jgi:hypothetical protein